VNKEIVQVDLYFWKGLHEKIWHIKLFVAMFSQYFYVLWYTLVVNY